MRPSRSGRKPRRFQRRLRCQVRSRSSASEQEVCSSPVVTMALMRFSSSGEPLTATLPCSMKALRRKTSRFTPVSCWPALEPSMPSTGVFVPE